MTTLDFVSLTALATPMLLAAAAKAALLIVGVGCIAWCAPRISAAVRHRIWAVAVVGALALPLLSALLPQWPVLPTGVGSDEPFQVVLTPGWTPVPSPTVPAEPGAATVPVVPDPVARDQHVPTRHAPLADAVVSASPGFTLPPWYVSVFIVWWVGMGLVLSAVAVSLVRLWGLGRVARPYGHAGWLASLRETTADLDITRPVTLLVSQAAVSPMTWGIRRPVILVPIVAGEWSSARRRDVLRHELAHVKRHDFAMQLVARVTCAVYWFNPLVWLATWRLRVEREQACDDVVIAAGTRPSEYAGHLLAIARSMRSAHAAGFAAVAMARRTQLGTRVQAVLEPDRNRRAATGTTAVMTWLAVVPVLGLLACVTPAASDPTPPAVRPVADAVPVAHARPVDRVAAAVAVVADPTPAPPSARRDRYFRMSVPDRDASLPGTVGQTTTWASAPECRERAGGRQGISENSNDDRLTSRWWDDGCEGTVSVRGQVRFTPAFDDIRSLTGNGRFSIEIDDGSNTRRVDVRRRNGSLERQWYVDGDQQTWGPEAEQWLRLALDDFFRHSSYALDERVDRILADRGVTGLLDEAQRAHGGYLKRRYYAAAIETGQLNPQDIRAILTRATRDITSDHEMGRLLRSISAQALQDGDLQRVYLGAANTIESSHERRQVLSAMLRQTGLTEDVVVALLQSASGMESDHELGRLLSEVGFSYLRNPRTQSAYLDATRRIESDFELRRVLSGLLELDNLDSGTRLALLQAAGSIESDHELGRLLQEAASKFVIDEALRPAFFEAISGIDSDHERQRVLSTLMRDGQAVPEALMIDILGAAAMISSDHELGRLLRRTVDQFGVAERYRLVFFRALSTVDSDHERGQILAALGRRNDPSPAVLNDAVTAIGAIGSDHTQVELIIQYGRKYRNRAEVRDRLVSIAEGLGSGYERRRALDALGVRTPG